MYQAKDFSITVVTVAVVVTMLDVSVSCPSLSQNEINNFQKVYLVSEISAHGCLWGCGEEVDDARVYGRRG